jgi:putative copper export protein
MSDALAILMRWLHLSSMATLVGGFLYSRLAVTPAAGELTPGPLRQQLEDKAAGRFRPFALAAMTAILISGLYNVFSVPGHSALYHALLGVKLLLVLHVFAVTLLIIRPGNPKRARLTTGALVSGLVIILISACLRRIF